MEWYLYPALILAGFVCSFINIFAGSGSLVTLPLLIFIGLPANVANGTNRVGIVVQNIVAVRSFRQQQVLDLRGGLILSVPAVLGSLLGARLALNLDEQMMRFVIGCLMVVMLGVIIARPRRWLDGRRERLSRRPSWKQVLVVFLIGVYGGFIQAGVGIFLLAGLVLGIGYDLVRANAVKVLIILFTTTSALIVFALNQQVDWAIGLAMGSGNILGAWVAARTAVQRGAVFAHRLLVAIVIVSAANLLGLFDLVSNLLAAVQ